MPVDLKAPMVLTEARDSLNARTPVGSILRSADWEKMPVALRNQAMFSAQVESMRFLSETKRRLDRRINLERGGQRMNRSRFVGDLRELASALGIRPDDPQKREGLQDVGSVRRLDLIYDTQIKMAEGHANWKRTQDPDVLDAFPAQELVRVQSREVPREWIRRWKAAGGELTSGRMVALINDGIWRRISRFGNPWPPFDFNSGMGLRKLSRAEAEDLGLLKTDEPVEPDDFEAQAEASLRGLTDPERGTLEAIFGDQVEISGDVIRWVKPLERAPYVTWADEGLDSVKTWTGLTAVPDEIPAPASAKRLQESFTVDAYDDTPVRFDEGLVFHWFGKMDSDQAARLSRLPAAIDTVLDPDEVWFQDSQRLLIKGFVDPVSGKKRGMALFITKDGNITRTYFFRNLNAIEKMRQGNSVIDRRTGR